jgi:hypothetical protein
MAAITLAFMLFVVILLSSCLSARIGPEQHDQRAVPKVTRVERHVLFEGTLGVLVSDPAFMFFVKPMTCASVRCSGLS